MSVMPTKEPSKYCFECKLHFKLMDVSDGQKVRIHVTERPEKSPTKDFYLCPICGMPLGFNPATLAGYAIILQTPP